MSNALDCERCGACCVNSDANQAEGYAGWIAVDPYCGVARDRKLEARYVTDSGEGPHMRLDGQGRCIALHGKLGHKVRCTVYAARPDPCRRVQPGDPDCLSARAERGLGDAPPLPPRVPRKRG